MNIKKRLGKNEKGAVAIYTALFLIGFLGIAAIGIDVNYLYGVRNELQNAADAGSLAGAGSLFDPDSGALTRDQAIAEAERIATANTTGRQAVVAKTVETGHWSFTTKTFTANASTTQTEWEERPFSELDVDPAFINAVRVETERAETPSFFARIFGFADILVGADAVAYIGFAGKLYPAELNQPIAICKESITSADESYSCNMGRMLNSGGNAATHNTGGWTNFTQPCGTASASDMNTLICANGNPDELEFGQGIGSTGGVQDSTLTALYNCWAAATGKTTNWNLTLPVVLCPGNNVSNCATLVGAVNVDVVWIVDKNDPHYNDVPREMTVNDGSTWTCSCSDKETCFTCWKSFVDEFNLANVDGPPLTDEEYEDMYQKKNIFFLPSCEVHEPTGNTGGENFGILAKIPKLVE
jgi:Flp pilus assembly protein TadG